MGLADRDYMRDNPRGLPWSATVVLMVVLVVVFALQCINDVYVDSLIVNWLALTPDALLRGYVWQFLSFQFLHVGLLHIAGNLLGLWFFGRFVENVLGQRKFLIAYFGSGVAGGLLQCLLTIFFPAHFAPFVFGASAGVMGVFAIFCRLEADTEIRWNFILPIPANVLLWITAGISLFFTIVPSTLGGGVAHAAHLGGLLAGLAWVKLGWHHDFNTLPWEGFWSRLRRWRPLESRQRKRELVKAASVRADRWRTPQTEPEDLPPSEFISREVDPILDKISQQGIQSLTEHERTILEAARKKMAKR